MAKVIAPNQLNIEVIPVSDGPNESTFFLPQPSPGGLKVLMMGGWTKVDALAAHILAGHAHEMEADPRGNVTIAQDLVEWARARAKGIIRAFTGPELPEVEEPKPLIIGAEQHA